MFAATSDALLCHTVASVISFYQRRLSPLKGFSCAPRVLHGGDSCSQFVKDLILQLGPGAAVVPTRMRLAACREANEMLRTGAFWPNTRGTGGVAGAGGAGGSEGAGTMWTTPPTLSTTRRTATGAGRIRWIATSATALPETGDRARDFAVS